METFFSEFSSLCRSSALKDAPYGKRHWFWQIRFNEYVEDVLCKTLLIFNKTRAICSLSHLELIFWRACFEDRSRKFEPALSDWLRLHETFSHFCAFQRLQWWHSRLNFRLPHHWIHAVRSQFVLWWRLQRASSKTPRCGLRKNTTDRLSVFCCYLRDTMSHFLSFFFKIKKARQAISRFSLLCYCTLILWKIQRSLSEKRFLRPRVLVLTFFVHKSKNGDFRKFLKPAIGHVKLKMSVNNCD